MKQYTCVLFFGKLICWVFVVFYIFWYDRCWSLSKAATLLNFYTKIVTIFFMCGENTCYIFYVLTSCLDVLEKKIVYNMFSNILTLEDKTHRATHVY